MSIRVFGALILTTTLVGCTAGPRVKLVPGSGVTHIPSTIAVYPILATESKGGAFRAMEMTPSGGVSSVDRDRIYIQPPSETKLMVTGKSQEFTDLLHMELSYQGFKVKELPIQVPDEWGRDAEGKPAFYISIGLLDRLREQFGLEAIVLGNVYFEGNRRGEVGVRAAYLRVVDIATLDVLCNASIDGGDYSLSLAASAGSVAMKLARMANLPEPQQ